ncbi:MAG TPA: GntR family transcriptional regulator [Terriglobales bacterium]|nr:GntR family transcriptional regulator [Terriglobales bacterium]
MDKSRLEARLRENPFTQLSEIVRDLIKDDILSFTLQPDTRVNGSKIAETLGISRTPVDEAIHALAGEGLLVQKEGRRGYYVYAMTRTAVEDLYYARKVVEGTASYLCALHNGQVDIARLKKMAYEFRDIFASHDYRRLGELDPAFHRLIVEFTRNDYLVRMYRALDSAISYHNGRLSHLLSESPELSVPSISTQHITICNAIEFGVPDMAQNAAVAHVDACADMLRRTIPLY